MTIRDALMGALAGGWQPEVDLWLAAEKAVGAELGLLEAGRELARLEAHGLVEQEPAGDHTPRRWRLAAAREQLALEVAA